MTWTYFQHRWFLPIFLFCAAIVFANVAHYLVFRLIRRKQEESGSQSSMKSAVQRHLAHPARAVFLLACVLAILPSVPLLPDDWGGILRQGLEMALIVALGWLGIGGAYFTETLIMRRYDLTVENNIQARRVNTQLQLFRRIVVTFLVIVTLGALMWSFHDQRLWQYGTGLLASAGLASLVLATAAKSTASNLLAGLQIAITEPIRLDDVVIVQGEWGRIEEITASYVVVRIWDQRRLIVPLTFFIENTFQNWTRESAEILGTSFLYVDYSIPVAELREQLDRIVHPSKLWDGRVCGLQVTNLSEHTMELRCLMSSRNASESFDLRCLVREEMTAYIQQHYPDAFPKTRFAPASSPAGGQAEPPSVFETALTGSSSRR
jgi:small-conductance mechanosensitive channel